MIISRQYKTRTMIMLTHPRVHLERYYWQVSLSKVFTGSDGCVSQSASEISVEALWGQFLASPFDSLPWGPWKDERDLL